MAKIVTGCKHCGHLFKIEEIFEGIDVECPKCGEKVIVSKVAERDEKGLLTFSEEMDPILKQLYEKAAEIEAAQAATAEEAGEGETEEGWESIAVAEEPGKPPSKRLKPPTKKKVPYKRKAPPPRTNLKKIVAAVVVLALVIAGIAYAYMKFRGDVVRKEKAKKLYLQAKDEYDEGRFEEAKVDFEELLEKYSDILETDKAKEAKNKVKWSADEIEVTKLMQKAEQLWESLKFNEAIAMYKKILEDYLDTRRKTEIEDRIKVLTAELEEKEAERDYKLAQGHKGKGEWEKAREILGHIAKGNSSFAMAAKLEVAKIDDYFRKAAKLYENGQEARANGKFGDAIDKFQEVIHKYPKSPSRHLAEKAIAETEEARRRGKEENYEQCMAQARGFESQRLYKEAAKNFEEALEYNRADPQATAGLARVKRLARLFENMIEIPAGKFTMGSDASDPDERPAHTVELDTFWISECPVTNEEYKEFVNKTGHPVPYVDAKWAKPYNWDKRTRQYPKGKGKHPVVLVSYDDAKTYCDWLGRRLPTEAEWERAARGLKRNLYPWGDNWPRQPRCNYGNINGGTTSVGTFPGGASDDGIMDMAGNVWEWCTDSYREDFYKSPEHKKKNPECTRNTRLEKVIRGGSWINSSDILRCSNRYYSTPDKRTIVIGFRTALTATE